MDCVLLLQPSPRRDVGDDAALVATTRALAPMQVVTATADPEHSQRVTGRPSIPATQRAVLHASAAADAVVVVGGRPLASTPPGERTPGLLRLATLLAAVRARGCRTALVAVGAGPLTGRRDALLARQVAIGSDLTVMVDAPSAAVLEAAGVPAPLRVGTDLAWLQLDDAPTDVPAGDDVRLVISAADVRAAGGAASVAAALAGVLSAVAPRLGSGFTVGVQAWHVGAGAGEDLDAAAAVGDVLRGLGLTSRVVAPPVSLSRSRDVLSTTRLVVSGQPHALMAAAAAGAPALAWPRADHASAVAEYLALPSVPASAPQQDIQVAAHQALELAGASLSAVREHVAAAGEVVALLRLLLTRGADVPGPLALDGAWHGRGPRPELRPRGVLR